MLDFLKINELDNVEVALRGTDTIPAGHKKAIKPIKKGEKVIKYGNPIGVATADIAEGEWVHTHNVREMSVRLWEQLCFVEHYNSVIAYCDTVELC